ncbi:hypothetical protein Bca4012_037807 [Brassica carinata]
MLLHQEVWVSIPEECRIIRRDLQHDARSTIKRGSHRAAQVMQSGVNLHTAGRIAEQADVRHNLKGPSSECIRLVGLVLLSQPPDSPPSPTGLLPWLPIIPNIPNILGLPNIPRFPNIPCLPDLPPFPPLPGLPGLPKLPRLPPFPGLPSLPVLPPLAPYQSGLMSVEMEKCLMKDGSKTMEKYFLQIFSSLAENVLHWTRSAVISF